MWSQFLFVRFMFQYKYFSGSKKSGHISELIIISGWLLTFSFCIHNCVFTNWDNVHLVCAVRHVASTGAVLYWFHCDVLTTYGSVVNLMHAYVLTELWRQYINMDSKYDATLTLCWCGVRLLGLNHHEQEWVFNMSCLTGHCEHPLHHTNVRTADA